MCCAVARVHRSILPSPQLFGSRRGKRFIAREDTRFARKRFLIFSVPSFFFNRSRRSRTQSQYHVPLLIHTFFTLLSPLALLPSAKLTSFPPELGNRPHFVKTTAFPTPHQKLRLDCYDCSTRFDSNRFPCSTL